MPFSLYATVICVGLMAQVLAAPFLLLDLIDDSYSIGLGPATMWVLGSVSLSLSFGGALWARGFQAWLGKYRGSLLKRLQHWGMGSEYQSSFGMGSIVFLGAWTGISIWVANTSSVLEIMEKEVDDFSLFFFLFYCVIIFLVPLVVEWSKLDDLKKKIVELDDLNPLFHDRFPPSEILSMYSCLKGAPKFYWDEYIKLPDHLISEATNYRFRARVESYYLRRTQLTQNTILVIALIAILFSLPTFVVTVIEAEWIQQVTRWLELT